MFIKHFRTVRFRVKDPLNPSRTVFDERLDWSGTHSLTHQGETFEADDAGWFDVPPETGDYFLRFPGWRTPEQVDEEVVAGRLRADDGDKLPSGPPATDAAKAYADENGIDISTVQGTGANGNVTKADVDAAIKARDEEEAARKQAEEEAAAAAAAKS